MEDLDDRYLEQLSLLDPEDWMNIPKPVSSALLEIKKAIMRQSQLFQVLQKGIRFVDDKIEVRVANLKTDVKQVNDNIFEIREEMQASMEVIEDKLNKKVLRLKSDVNNTLEESMTEFKKRLAGMNEQIVQVNKKIETLPTHPAVDAKIAEADEHLRVKVLHEVEEFYVRPVDLRLNTKIDTISDEMRADVDRRLKIVETRALEFKKATTEKFARNDKELEAKMQVQKAELSKQIDQLTQFARQTQAAASAFEQSAQQQFAAVQQQIQDAQTAAQSATAALASTVDGLSTKAEDLRAKNLVLADDLKRFKDQTLQELNRLGEAQGNVEMLANMQPEFEMPELPLDEIYAEVDDRIQALRDELQKGPSITKEIKRVREDIEHMLTPIRSQLANSRDSVDNSINDLKAKLAWLPLSLVQLEGMTPTEARLFTLEARLRSEENLRLKMQRTLNKLYEKFSLVAPTEAGGGETCRSALTALAHRRSHLVSLDRNPLKEPRHFDEDLPSRREENTVRTPRVPRLPVMNKKPN